MTAENNQTAPRVRDPNGYLFSPNGKVYLYTDFDSLKGILVDRRLMLKRWDLVREHDEGLSVYEFAIPLVEELGKKYGIASDDIQAITSLLHPSANGTVLRHSSRCRGYNGKDPYCSCMPYIISFTCLGLNSRSDRSECRFTNRELQLEFNYRDLNSLDYDSPVCMELRDAGNGQAYARSQLKSMMDSLLSDFASGRMTKSDAVKELICCVDELRFSIFDETHMEEGDCRLIAYPIYDPRNVTERIEIDLPDLDDPFLVGMNPGWCNTSLEECDAELKKAGFIRPAHMIERDIDSLRIDQSSSIRKI